MTVPATELLRRIQECRLRVFTTSDVLTLTGLARPAATQALRRLAVRGLIARIKRGVWVNLLVHDLNPWEAVSHLRAPWPSYISLYSALAEYGVFEEIPHIIYAFSSASPKPYQTRMGSFHIHHLPSRHIWGYEIKRVGESLYPIAEPEKAYLDLLYLALVPRSPIKLPPARFNSRRLDKGKLKKYAARFKFTPMSDYLLAKHI